MYAYTLIIYSLSAVLHKCALLQFIFYQEPLIFSPKRQVSNLFASSKGTVMHAGVQVAPPLLSVVGRFQSRRIGRGASSKAERSAVVRCAISSQSIDTKMYGPTVLVVGGGRVGTYVACKFKSAGTTSDVVLKGSPASRGVSDMQVFVDTMCADASVTFVRDYKQHVHKTFDFIFISVKTYDLPNVKKELDQFKITGAITILVHNGIVAPLFENSVRVVIPQSYDFVEETIDGEVGQKIKKINIHVKNEEKPWVMPDTSEAKKVELLLKQSGILGQADPTFPYGLVRKFFINGVANLLSIVGDCNCDGLLLNHRERMELLYAEFMAVLKAPHADAFAMLPPDFHEIVFTGLASYGQHFPSTKMDFDVGRALEIDSLNGYVVGQAKAQGIQCPENEKLVEEVKLLVKERDDAKKVA